MKTSNIILTLTLFAIAIIPGCKMSGIEKSTRAEVIKQLTMKSLKHLYLYIFLSLLNFSVCLAQYEIEILKLSRIDLLPAYRANIISEQVSSYDTTGGNNDGFTGKYSFLREENGAQVIAELEGPGIIHRIWTPTPSEDTIQFFFDREATPRIEMKFIDLFSGKHFPFIMPVVGNEVRFLLLFTHSIQRIL